MLTTIAARIANLPDNEVWMKRLANALLVVETVGVADADVYMDEDTIVIYPVNDPELLSAIDRICVGEEVVTVVPQPFEFRIADNDIVRINVLVRLRNVIMGMNNHYVGATRSVVGL